ncbi:hypothetical protein VZO05_15375 [Aggregatilineales bacterium SYSU G02658]
MSDHPPLSPSQQERMQEARTLIKSGQYGDAVRLLKTVDHPLAHSWLDKLREKLAVKAVDSANAAAPASETRRKQADERAYSSSDQKSKRSHHREVEKQKRGSNQWMLIFLAVPLSCVSLCLLSALFGTPNLQISINETPVLVVTHEATVRPTRAPLTFRIPIYERNYDDWPPNNEHVLGDLTQTSKNRSDRGGGWTFTLNPGESPGIFVRPSTVFIDRVRLFLFQRTPQGGARFLRESSQNYGTGTIFTVPQQARISHSGYEGGEYFVVVYLYYEGNHNVSYDIELVRTRR